MMRQTDDPLTETDWRRDMPREERTPHILVAEDDVDMRVLLAQALRSIGYEVAELSDGLRLVARLASTDARYYDLIVSDIRMPGASGLDILEGLKACRKAPPMILITAFGDPETHELARQLGAAAMFDKPFDVEDLLAEVRRIAPLPSRP